MLLAVKTISRMDTTRFRILLGSIVGGLSSLLLFLDDLGIIMTLLKVLSAVIMSMISFGIKPIKIKTIFEVDNGLRFTLNGKNSGGSMVRLGFCSVLLLDEKWERYIKRLESFSEKKRKDPKFVYVTFKGYEDINLVEKYKGCDLKFPLENLRELEEDNYYYYQLMDCEVYLNETLIGKVVSIETSHKNEMIRIKDKENKEHLVLFMKQFVKDVDIENKKIYLNDVEGLL
jgi:16S rRNA processing protein RimM